MNLPLISLIGLSVLYLVGLGFSCSYFVRFFRTRDKGALWIALLGLFGIPGLVMVFLVAFFGIAEYIGNVRYSGGLVEPCGLMGPCLPAKHVYRDKIINAAAGVAYLGCVVFSVISFFRFYRTKEKCSFWLALLLFLGLPGILVLYALFDSLVLN